MSILINPGAGKVSEDCGYEQAYTNIKQFIKDCEAEIYIINSKHIPNYDGRYEFTVKTKKGDIEIEIEMPSLPLENVRFMSGTGQNPLEFPRLYIDGSSWLWCYALISNGHLKEWIENKIEGLTDDIARLKEDLQ